MLQPPGSDSRSRETEGRRRHWARRSAPRGAVGRLKAARKPAPLACEGANGASGQQPPLGFTAGTAPRRAGAAKATGGRGMGCDEIGQQVLPGRRAQSVRTRARRRSARRGTGSSCRTRGEPPDPVPNGRRRDGQGTADGPEARPLSVGYQPGADDLDPVEPAKQCAIGEYHVSTATLHASASPWPQPLKPGAVANPPAAGVAPWPKPPCAGRTPQITGGDSGSHPRSGRFRDDQSASPVANRRLRSSRSIRAKSFTY